MSENVEILIGDVFDRLGDLADESVDCVVTSPPYWGLRDYGVEGQIGLEPTMGEHIETLLRVFAEVWRILKPAGTVWLNYGDAYAGSYGAQGRDNAALPAASISRNSMLALQKEPIQAV